MKTNLLIVAKPPSNPTTRYRILPLIRALKTEAYNVNLLASDAGFIGKFKLLSKARNADLLIIQRKLFGPIMLRLLSRLCKHIVYDFDDAVFSKSNGTASHRRANRFRHTVEIASLVWAGNQYLADTAEQIKPNITQYLPTNIELVKYQSIKRQPLHQSEAGPETAPKTTPGHITKLIWIGSKSTRKYLEAHRPIFESLGKQIKNLKLVIVADFEFSLEHLPVESIAWSEAAELSALQSATIGIAPMSDDNWSRGKCALKVLQYMAAGLPVISSNVGANCQAIEQGETGYLAADEKQWLDAIKNLQDNPKLAHDMGQRGRAKLEENYNADSWVTKQVQSLKVLLAN